MISSPNITLKGAIILVSCPTIVPFSSLPLRLNFNVHDSGMIIVLFFIICIYGSEFASMVRFPEFLILKKIDFMGYLSNIENILVTEWIFNILISSWVCIKVLKDNMNNKLFYLIIILLVFVQEMFFNRNYVFILYFKQYFYYIAFMLVLLSLVIKKRKI